MPTNKSDAGDFKQHCRDIADFPKKGIIFRDITPLLKNGPIFKRVIDHLAEQYASQKIDVIVAIEARGFIIGAALAYRLGIGLVPVRKKGKLPWKVYRKSYELEYGEDHLEVHQDGIEPGARALIVDDVIATGGTVEAVACLVKELRGEVAGAAFLIELTGLKGIEKLSGIPVYALMKY